MEEVRGGAAVVSPPGEAATAGLSTNLGGGMEGYIEIVYRDGRRVEGPLGHLHQFVESGAAKPARTHLKAYLLWRKQQGLGGWSSASVPTPDETDEVEVEQESEDAVEAPPDFHAEVTTGPADPADYPDRSGPPPGYEVQERPPWYTAFTPQAVKIGKAQQSKEGALLLAWQHFLGESTG